jgi:DNA-binding NarL/FixJ family response regulator
LEKSAIQVFLVDDYEPWRQYLATRLSSQPELHVIGKASDGLQAVETISALQPDLVILDIGLPGLNGIEVARRIRRQNPKSKILFVSENCSPDVAAEALGAGAGGYVVKSDAASELLPAVWAVLEGKQFVSARLSPDIVDSATETSDSHHTDANPYLTFRQNASISQFLKSMIDATGADCGTAQLYDSRNRVLRLVAHHGFETEFLDYFDTVGCDHNCVCSKAMNDRSRCVVTEVLTDPLFSIDSRGVLLRAKVRSIQSTPLYTASGELLGMVSTHYRRPGGPKPDMWKPVDDLAASFTALIQA